MRIGTYRFDCLMTTAAQVPAYKGSMLRGAFGHAFKKVCCALRRQECTSCLLTETCPYSYVFEVHATTPAEASGRTRVSARPHPYTLSPPLSDNREYQAGERFSFDLTLFGRGNDYLPHIVYAVETMGENGIGSRIGDNRGRFVLEGIEMGSQRIYDRKSRQLHRGPGLDTLTVTPNQTENQAAMEELTIHFQTPLRLKHQNELQDTLPFHLLIRAALRRVAILEEHYGDGEPPLDYRGLVRRAEAVRTVASDCRWFELERYSARQKSAMLLGGLTGTIRYQGALGEFLPLLRYCEQTRLGKQTTFGLGQLVVQAGDAP